MKFNKLSVLLPSILGTTVTAVGPNDFDWETITPGRKLEYYPCYEKLQCARLIVPLDWQDETNEHTVAVAIAKLPAKVPDDDPSFGGTIFTNPGGPGGSGVAFMLSEGDTLQKIADGNKKYEILSWDPRGVSFTSPKADCFGDIAARDVADIQERATGPLDSSPDALRRQWARTQAYGKLCEQGAVNGSILPYSTTPSVVRDMVEILDQIHELRGEVPRPLHEVQDDSEKILELRKTDVPRIQYWGFSYGSILGNTFASMYPGRVGRLIIDGIADSDDYMTGTWATNLQDTEKIVDYFYKSCFEAGDKCALKRSSDTEWEDMKERVDKFIAYADVEPISILEGNKITIITATELLSAFKGPVYAPMDRFQRLATLLDGALEGNYTLLLEDLQASTPRLHDTCSFPNSSTIATLNGQDAAVAIKCGDGEDETHHGIQHFESYIEELKSQSPTLGGYWSNIRFICSGWRIRPKYRYTGPFTTPKHDSSLVEGKPAAPLLFLSSRLDPVTPLRNAVAMSSKHPGAAWVVQESAGHCTLITASKCTQRIVQDYLEFGTVPKTGTVCEADCDPWNPCEGETVLRINAAEEHMWSHRFI
ncbi:TAP-like protein-domain-containing protein [Xylariales sp. AK1849]|nr:TAP-like protein-domain-containing protein [Xylariales sp. AK1849]